MCVGGGGGGGFTLRHCGGMQEGLLPVLTQWDRKGN